MQEVLTILLTVLGGLGIFMLIPAEVLPLVRPHLPESGFAPIQIVVGVVYVLAVIGMYGMFYPWRIESVLHRLGLMDHPELPEEGEKK